MAEYSQSIFKKPLFTEIEENNCISIYKLGDKHKTFTKSKQEVGCLISMRNLCMKLTVCTKMAALRTS